MTLVNTETGEMLETMTRAEAEDFVRFMRAAQDQIPRRIIDAYHRRAWIPLGYPTWESMIAAEGLAIRLPRDERHEMVLAYSAAGLSTRAIAPVLGASQRTVSNDLQVSKIAHLPQIPESSSSTNVEDGNAESSVDGDGDATAADGDSGQTPEGEEQGEAPSPSEDPHPRPPVTGIDGKTYTRPAPKPPATVLDNSEAEYANAEKSSLALSRAVSKLLQFQHPNMRDVMRKYWKTASIEVPPTSRRDVTPEQMRVAAHGLLTLADEWDAS